MNCIFCLHYLVITNLATALDENFSAVPTTPTKSVLTTPTKFNFTSPSTSALSPAAYSPAKRQRTGSLSTVGKFTTLFYNSKGSIKCIVFSTLKNTK